MEKEKRKSSCKIRRSFRSFGKMTANPKAMEYATWNPSNGIKWSQDRKDAYLPF